MRRRIRRRGPGGASGERLLARRKRREAVLHQITAALGSAYVPPAPNAGPERVVLRGRRYAQPRSTVAWERWAEVRDQVARCGLRATARSLGVSHEAVRQIVKRA